MGWKFGLVCLIFLSLEIQGQVIKSVDVIVEENENVVLWCALEAGFSACKWTLPSGTECAVDSLSPTCNLDPKVTLSPESLGNPTNCSIVISRVTELYHGEWKCSLKSSQSDKFFSNIINMSVAKAAKVEFFPVFGTLRQMRGTSSELSCVARRGRPIGSFKWRIGEETDPDVRYLENEGIPKKDEDAMGYPEVTESVQYVARDEDSGKRLHCTYVQFDTSGRLLFSEEDSLNLIVNYLEEPTGPRTEATGQVGNSMNISFQFEVSPRPQPEDVAWVIKAGIDSKTIRLANSEVRQTHYVAYPMVQLSPTQYEATLMLMDVQKEEESYQHELRIQIRDPNTKEAIKTVIHEFEVIVNEADSANLIIIIVLSVVAALVLILSIFIIICWAKRSHKCCFKQNTPFMDQPEIQHLHMETEYNMSPIIRNAKPRP
eukprot:maker-scaffold579_size130606-snap-gene-0.24 protein:Tk02357 transcript:maker-scaffold579_size130606-snap-gene-0.24-mRNA-1 annotation:"fasciclin "